MLHMCHCAVYRIREDLFCLTGYQLSATRWGSFPLLRKAPLSTHTPLMFGVDLHSYPSHRSIATFEICGIFIRYKNTYLFYCKTTCFPGPYYPSIFGQEKILYIEQKTVIFVKVFIIPHHHGRQQSPVSVWGVTFWLNECHAILHTASHGGSFDAHFSALWSLQVFYPEWGVDRSCVVQDPPQLFVPVFIWGGSPCLHHSLGIRMAANCSQHTFGFLSELIKRWRQAGLFSVSGFYLVVIAWAVEWMSQRQRRRHSGQRKCNFPSITQTQIIFQVAYLHTRDP